MAASPSFAPRSELRALVGPTAAGKTALALAVAERAGAELVSLDSMQVYRGMDIGTAKASADERARVPHHMLDLVNADERFDVQRFLSGLKPVLADLDARGVRALFVGGTAFYLKALTHGLFDGPPADLELRAELDAELERLGASAMHTQLAAVDATSAARLHENDTRRVLRALEVYRQTGKPLSQVQQQWGWDGSAAPTCERYLVGVGHAVPDLDARIAARTRQMLDAGWTEEAVKIRDTCGFGETSIQALGYSQVLRHADGELTREQCIAEVALRTRQFARKQRTWYRKFEDITWLDGGEELSLEQRTLAAIEAFGWAD